MDLQTLDQLSFMGPLLQIMSAGDTFQTPGLAHQTAATGNTSAAPVPTDPTAKPAAGNSAQDVLKQLGAQTVPDSVAGTTGGGGGTSRGSAGDLGTGNPSGGQPGSAGTGFGKSAMDTAVGLAGGMIAPGFGVALSAVEALTGQPQSGVLGALGIGPAQNQNLGTMAANIDINPGAYPGLEGLDPGSLSAASQEIGAAVGATQSARGLSTDPNAAVGGGSPDIGPGGAVGTDPGGTPGTGQGNAPGGAPGGVDSGLGSGSGQGSSGTGVGAGGSGPGGPGIGGGGSDTGTGDGTGYSSGGKVKGGSGPGGPGKKVTIDAHEGEGVLTRKTMAVIGEKTLKQINKIAEGDEPRHKKLIAIREAFGKTKPKKEAA